MTDCPSGTVTFLFTDIEGSTQLLHDLGTDRYRDALESHRVVLREVFANHAGFEVDTQGDAFFVAFARAQDAVRAAGAAQRALSSHTWPDGHDLRARMGIHTCEAQASGEGYVGVGVHRGARICAAGHGGQVLLSHTTYDLIEEEETGFGLLDLGEHRLKDLSEPHRLFQLVDHTLHRTFPALRTLENRPMNLPIQLTPLIGRERAIAEITGLLRRARLVTLTGPGGTGKTRLALQAAAELVEEFPNGVFFVALAAITDPELVIPTVAQAIGVSEAGGQSLSAYLSKKHLLLVLDNFEQVVAAAVQVAELLMSASDIRVLTTSREPLHLAAEHIYPVPPLALPDTRRLPELAVLSQYEAVALFAQRAQAVQPGFAVTTANAPAVAEICVRLDGLPLALELAAARIPLLTPEALLKRLGERLKLLRDGARDLPARQQTLRDTLAWSFDLLNDGERQLFARLGVFAGGFTIEAAEAVCGAELDTLASLVDKNLVRRDGERLMMLETIREYALEQLAAGTDEDTVRGCHAAFFEELAEGAYLERFEHEGERSGELEREHDNLRAALDWLAGREPERCLRLAGALGWFWHAHSHLAEGRARLTPALAGTPDRNADRARALASAGQLAAWQADMTAARPLIDEAVSIWRELGREQEVVFALHDLGWGYSIVGDDAAARRYLEESLELQRSLGRPLLVNRAQVELFFALVSMGEIETVERQAPETLALARQLGDLRSEHFAHHYLGDCALMRGDSVRAAERYHRSLELAVGLGDRMEIATEIQGVAMAAAGNGQAERALRFGAAGAAELDALGIDYSGVRFWVELLDRYLDRAREMLGAEAAERAWEEGRRMGFERAIQEALARVPEE